MAVLAQHPHIALLLMQGRSRLARSPLLSTRMLGPTLLVLPSPMDTLAVLIHLHITILMRRPLCTTKKVMDGDLEPLPPREAPLHGQVIRPRMSTVRTRLRVLARHLVPHPDDP